MAEVWNLPPPVQEAIQLYPDHTYHQAVSPTKGTVITCLAGHLASWLFHPSSQAEEDLRALPVVQALNFYPDDMTALFDQRDKILHQMDVFLV